MRQRLLHIIMLVLVIIVAAPHAMAQFYGIDAAPKPVEFMLPQPNITDPMMAADLYRNYEAKVFRDSSFFAESKLACYYDYRPSYKSTLQSYYYAYHLKYYKTAFGLLTNKTSNTEFSFFLDSCRLSCIISLDSLPSSWTHERPCYHLRFDNFAMKPSRYYMNDYTTSPKMGFPSYETTSSWLTGALMAMINPWNADTILSQTDLHGWYRLVCGATWHSDVEASRLIASTSFAHLISMPVVRQRIKELRELLRQRLDITATPCSTSDVMDNDSLILSMSKRLLPPPQLSHGSMQSDLLYYIQQLHRRDSLEAGDVLAESFYDEENPIDCLQGLIGISVSPEQTPCLYELLTNVLDCSEKMCTLAQSRFERRQRPFEVFGTEPFTLESTEQLRQTCSYPSIHAAEGWATALVMAMICPEMQDTIFNVGYNYGEHRVVAGTTWRSDVIAGRTIGLQTVALLASSDGFVDLLESAMDEYNEIKDRIITDMMPIHSDGDTQDTPMFTIDGRKATQESRGVLVGKNKKVFVP